MLAYGRMKGNTALAVHPLLLADVAAGALTLEQALKDMGLPDQAVQALSSDPLLLKRVEQERKLIEKLEDPDLYHNRVCYQVLRNRLVALAEAGELPPDVLLKATDMLYRHAGLGSSAADQTSGKGPVLNIIVNTGAEEKRITISSDAKRVVDSDEDELPALVGTSPPSDLPGDPSIDDDLIAGAD